MRIVTQPIKLNELAQIAAALFGNLVKGVVDIDRGLLALDAELHADLEAFLLEKGSKQKYLWGINLYPEMPENEFIEFDSMINMRPSQGNRSRGVENEETRSRIVAIVKKIIVR